MKKRKTIAGANSNSAGNGNTSTAHLSSLSEDIKRSTDAKFAVNALLFPFHSPIMGSCKLSGLPEPHHGALAGDWQEVKH
jgi:hypothetical protein